MEYFENEKKQQRVLLVCVDTGEYDAQSSLDELWELSESAGAEPVATLTQKKDRPDTATYVGSGRLEEIKNFCENQDIDVLIFDCELTPTQIRNIEQATGIRTIDRTMLILDIFALRARSKEGKLQVELAQLNYMLPRLTGKGAEMSRLGGGIGTRGPGETKLETDRRHIRRRMETLKEQLRDVKQHRDMLKSRRKKDGIITVAIVGYTNAGKSTLMNCLTDAGVLAEDKLFATLDPTSRALKLPNGVSVMLTDTVGLVRRLPHHLVEAFKSELFESLGCTSSPIIPVLNKWDRVNEKSGVIPMVSGAVRISAINGTGIDKLLERIEENLPVEIRRVKLLIPFDKGRIAAEVREKATLLEEKYSENGIVITALLKPDMYGRLKEYVVD